MRTGLKDDSTPYFYLGVESTGKRIANDVFMALFSLAVKRERGGNQEKKIVLRYSHHTLALTIAKAINEKCNYAKYTLTSEEVKVGFSSMLAQKIADLMASQFASSGVQRTQKGSTEVVEFSPSLPDMTTIATKIPKQGFCFVTS